MSSEAIDYAVLGAILGLMIGVLAGIWSWIKRQLVARLRHRDRGLYALHASPLPSLSRAMRRYLQRVFVLPAPADLLFGVLVTTAR